MDYTPHTEEEVQAMLEKVGVETLEDLYATCPRRS
jgi:glycine dehydrogenase subunit 1